MTIYNEYSELKSVLVGKTFSSDILFDLYGETDSVKYYGRINDETNEDLDRLDEYLTSIGVTVYRPNIEKVYDLQKIYGDTLVGPGSSRDFFLAYGKDIFIYNTSWTYRNLEHLYWEDTWDKLESRGYTINLPENNLDDVQKFTDFEQLTIKLRQQFDEDFENNRNIVFEQLKYIITRPTLKKIFEDLLRCDVWDDSLNRAKLKMIYVYEGLSDYSLIHSASFFRLNENIVANPGPSTEKGFNDICNKLDTKYGAKVNDNTNKLGHIDGDISIINEKQYVCQENFKPLEDLGLECIHSNIPVATSDIESGPLEQWNLFSDKEIDPDMYHSKKRKEEFLKFYLENLRGYDQRVDFDFNFLTIKPNKILCGIHDKNKIKELNDKGIETVNIPLRHRWVIDGGVHCYTNDIERYD